MNQNNILNIIDADTILFLVAYRLQTTEDIEVCKQQTNTFINLILSNTNSHYYLGFLGGSGNFRKELSTDYKANRPPRPDYMVKWEPYIRQILIDDWGFIAVDNMEAEDALVIAYTYYKDICNVIVSHIDKDLCWIEGNHYDYKEHKHWYSDKHGKLWIHTSPNGKSKKLKGCGLMYYYAQLLDGDWSTDGVKGLKGYGPVKIHKLLGECTTEYSLLRKVYTAYLKESSKDAFLLVRQLIKMLDTPPEGWVMPTPIKYNRIEQLTINDLV